VSGRDAGRSRNAGREPSDAQEVVGGTDECCGKRFWASPRKRVRPKLAVVFMHPKTFSIIRRTPMLTAYPLALVVRPSIADRQAVAILRDMR